MSSSPVLKERHANLLKERRLKATPIRLALLHVLEAMHEPLGIHELIDQLPKGIKADKVTVYRAIEAFIETGLVRQVNMRHGHTDYEFALVPDHHHLVCTSCGRMEEFEECDIEHISKTVLRKHPNFVSIQDHALELFGLCKKCSD